MALRQFHITMILIKVCGKGATASFTLGLIDLVFEPITQTVIFHDTIIDVWEDFKCNQV